MNGTLVLSDSALRMSGILLLSLLAVEWGGTFMLRVVRGTVPMTEFQRSFARAGHAHAGVLVVLALVCVLYAEAAGLAGPSGWLARSGVAFAAILMPAGFFFSSMGAGRQGPSRWIWLTYAGAALLAAGVATLGLGLLLA